MLPSTRIFHSTGPVFALVFCLIFTVASSRLAAQSASQVYAQGAEAYNRGDVEAAKQKLQTALQIDRNFRPASLLLTRIADEKKRAASPESSGKTLERTIVPVEFNNTTLGTALEVIRQRVAADSGNKLVINFAVNLPPELVNKQISLKMERVPVLELLRYIGELAGVKFERQPYAIVVTPAGATPAATPAVSTTSTPSVGG